MIIGKTGAKGQLSLLSSLNEAGAGEDFCCCWEEGAGHQLLGKAGTEG